MIVIKVDMWPGGDSKRAYNLFEAIIHNVSRLSTLSDYEYVISKRGGFKTTPDKIARVDVKHILRRGIVTRFPRLRLGAADLLYRCLKAGFGDRNDRE
jgi:two-component SAPR family response regulator